jgi:chromosome segregation ATPase
VPFQDEINRARVREAEREMRKLFANVEQLLKDMKDVKKRLDRLERQSGQTQAGVEHHHQSDSDA